jgi:hypothetical protein
MFKKYSKKIDYLFRLLMRPRLYIPLHYHGTHQPDDSDKLLDILCRYVVPQTIAIKCKNIRPAPGGECGCLKGLKRAQSSPGVHTRELFSVAFF